MFNEADDPQIRSDVIPLHAASADPIVLPHPSTLFEDRARRFDHFAARGDAQQPFFTVMAFLSRAQQAAALRFVPGGLPDAAMLATRHAHRMPILPAALSDRDASWITALRAVLDAPDHDIPLPTAIRAARRMLQGLPDDVIDRLGDALLAYEYETIPVDLVPWIAAGLQVYWTAAVAALGRDAARAIDVAGVCPCCGSLPVASVRRIGGNQQGLRYLVCSLCATQWHMVRIKCSHCESTAGIGYLTLSSDPDSEPGKAAAAREVVKAEVCDDCSSYLKLVSLEADHQADPVADDLATLALDLMTDERGYARIGPNLFIHPGISGTGP